MIATGQFWIANEDCRTALAKVPDNSFHCCVTSPPYWGLRDYGVEGQVGLELDFQVYVAAIVEIFREVRRVLREDGTCWLNLGDSYGRAPQKGGSGPNGKNEDRWGYGAANKARVVDPNSKQASNRASDIDTVPRNATVGSSDGAVGRADRPGTRAIGVKPKDLCGIPWRVAFALQQDGWYLRQDIIWAKPNPMPESVRDRCTKSHEYLFLLSKSEKYYFDAEAIKEPAAYNPEKTKFPDGWATGSGGHGSFHRKGREKGRASGNKSHKAVTEYEQSTSEEHRTKAGLLKISEKAYATRNKRDVWTIATAPFPDAHFATFPPALVKPCILAGCPENGFVLDPFGGAGTTALVANRLNRHALLIELNSEYAVMAERRIRADQQKGNPP